MTLLPKAYSFLLSAKKQQFRQVDFDLQNDVMRLLTEEADIKDDSTLVAALLSCIAHSLSAETLLLEFGEFVAHVIEHFAVLDPNESRVSLAKKMLLLTTTIADKAVACPEGVEHAVALIHLATHYQQLRNILSSVPDHWTKQRLQGYCFHVYKIVEPLRKINVRLDALFSRLFQKEVELDCKTFSCLPAAEDQVEQEYFAFLEMLDQESNTD